MELVTSCLPSRKTQGYAKMYVVIIQFLQNKAAKVNISFPIIIFHFYPQWFSNHMTGNMSATDFPEITLLFEIST